MKEGVSGALSEEPVEAAREVVVVVVLEDVRAGVDADQRGRGVVVGVEAGGAREDWHRGSAGGRGCVRFRRTRRCDVARHRERGGDPERRR